MIQTGVDEGGGRTVGLLADREEMVEIADKPDKMVKYENVPRPDQH